MSHPICLFTIQKTSRGVAFDYLGSPQGMNARYQDAMAIVRTLGKPEIQENLLLYNKAEDLSLRRGRECDEMQWKRRLRSKTHYGLHDPDLNVRGKVAWPILLRLPKQPPRTFAKRSSSWPPRLRYIRH
eukprot:scaffold95203_cov32-Prasinocladus_malaysianus.AAC.2